MNNFAADHAEADRRGLPPTAYEYALHVQVGQAHATKDANAAGIHEFLFREFDGTASPQRSPGRHAIRAPGT